MYKVLGQTSKVSFPYQNKENAHTNVLSKMSDFWVQLKNYNQNECIKYVIF